MKIKVKRLTSNEVEEINKILILEQEIFGENGAIDIWNLKPLIKNGLVLVLYEDDKIIGVSEFIRNFDNYSNIYLYGFFILPTYQGKGYGSMLMERSIEYLKRNAIDYISLTVNPNNFKAIKFYLKNKFVKTKFLKNEYGIKNNRFLLERKID